MTGSSVFDFEGDGAAEVVYADEETLWIFDGATGTIEMAWTEHGSGTRFEYPDQFGHSNTTKKSDEQPCKSLLKSPKNVSVSWIVFLIHTCH